MITASPFSEAMGFLTPWGLAGCCETESAGLGGMTPGSNGLPGPFCVPVSTSDVFLSSSLNGETTGALAVVGTGATSGTMGTDVSIFGLEIWLSRQQAHLQEGSAFQVSTPEQASKVPRPLQVFFLSQGGMPKEALGAVTGITDLRVNRIHTWTITTFLQRPALNPLIPLIRTRASV